MPGSKRAVADVELDLGRYELRRSGRRIKLEKKPMELLIFLAGRREQMVSREDIVKKLWRSDLFIDTDRNLNNIIRKIRTALRDNPAKPRFLETVVGKGYRFIGPVRVIDAQYPRSDLAQDSAQVRGRENLDERSSLAVVPLLLLGKKADDHGVCLGFADSLVTRLGNLQGLDVLPTSAVLTLPPEAAPSDIAARLGIRFVVHGAIQMSKGQWRLSLEMFDAYLQRSCFTRMCDLDLGRLSDIENDIAKQIAGVLKRPLSSATVQQRQRYSRDPLAYAEFMRGFRLSASGDAAQMDKASQHLAP
jgi:DNA-binding winged helix-turn-helix (wHTH) protein